MPGFNLNTVTLSGGLTSDPELRSLPSGTAVCKLRMAFTERIKNGASGEWEDRSNYIDCVVWAGLGEWCAREMAKGTQIVVTGRLRWHDWEDKDTGKKRSAHEIVVDSIFRDRGAGGGGGGKGGFAARDEATFGTPPGAGTPDFAPPGGGSGGSGESGGGFTPRSTVPADDDIPF